MVAFLSILLAVVLLGVTVYGLHRYQTMEVEYTVDRSMPLPPLEAGDKPSAKANDSLATGEKAIASKAQNSKKNSEKSNKNSRSPQSWLNRVADLKKSGELAEAMTVCEQEFPLWGAYNQACIIERLNFKDESLSDEELEAGLQRLYRLAVTAELLHDKSVDGEHLSLNQLKTLDLDRVNELEHSYQDIGYAHLRLIRKSDIKIMLAQWGRPEQHTPPRSHHQQWWQAFTRDLG